MKWREVLAKAGISKGVELIPVDPAMHYVMLVDERYVSEACQEALAQCLTDAKISVTFIRMADIDGGFRFFELKP